MQSPPVPHFNFHYNPLSPSTNPIFEKSEAPKKKQFQQENPAPLYESHSRIHRLIRFCPILCNPHQKRHSALRERMKCGIYSVAQLNIHGPDKGKPEATPGHKGTGLIETAGPPKDTCVLDTLHRLRRHRDKGGFFISRRAAESDTVVDNHNAGGGR